MQTSIKQLTKYPSCCDNVTNLRTALKYEKLTQYKENRLIDFNFILSTCGVRDTFRALCTQSKKVIRSISADIASSVLFVYEKVNPGDYRLRECIEGLYNFCDNKILEDDLDILKDEALNIVDHCSIKYSGSTETHSAATTAYAFTNAFWCAESASNAVYDQWGRNKKILLKYI